MNAHPLHVDLVFQAELHRFLASPSVYPEPTAPPRCVETHISQVYLTDHFAYKLKKPVRFDFLDFSTPELRHAACLEELRLNQRLAPDVYLQVLPITRTTTGEFQLGGSAKPIDWLVKMRRLADAETLWSGIKSAGVAGSQIVALSKHLAAFYRQREPLKLSSDEYRAQIERHVRSNYTELLHDESLFPPHKIQRIHAAQLTYLSLHSDVFDARITAGRVVDGHGDLRPEHIYLTSPPVIIDCIEFSAEYRAVDVLDELSFLETECALLDAPDTGRDLRAACLALLDDAPPQELMAFYKSYRACVRAKVALLRTRQLPKAEAEPQTLLARQYIELADKIEKQIGPPLLVLVCGHSGSGKSTVARALADRLGIEVLATDRLRQTLVYAGELPADPRGGKYDTAQRERVYGELDSQTAALLAQGSSVILDGTFLFESQRVRAAQLAQFHCARWLIIECVCPADTAKHRIAARLALEGTLSEAHPELVDVQLAKRDLESFSEPVLRCDTTRPIQLIIPDLIERLRAL